MKIASLIQAGGPNAIEQFERALDALKGHEITVPLDSDELDIIWTEFRRPGLLAQVGRLAKPHVFKGAVSYSWSRAYYEDRRAGLMMVPTRHDGLVVGIQSENGIAALMSESGQVWLRIKELEYRRVLCPEFPWAWEICAAGWKCAFRRFDVSRGRISLQIPSGEVSVQVFGYGKRNAVLGDVPKSASLSSEDLIALRLFSWWFQCSVFPPST